MAEPDPNAAVDPAPAANAGSELRKNAGLWAVLGGLVVLALVAAFSIFRYSAANDAANVIAAVGTVVGAFFGVHVGAAAGAQAQQNALNNVRASNQQALDAVHQNTNKLVQAAVALQPGSEAANQLLAGLQ
jgi:flagellar basal body-associated protein FliL